MAKEPEAGPHDRHSPGTPTGQEERRSGAGDERPSPREGAAASEPMEIVGAYARALDESPPGAHVRPESRLPYPRKTIEEALRAVLATVTDAASQKALRVGLQVLRTFIPDHEVPEDPTEETLLAVVLLGRESAREELLGVLKCARAIHGGSLTGEFPGAGEQAARVGVAGSTDADRFVEEHSAAGRVFRNSGDLDQAAEEYQAIVARFPDNREARSELRDLYREKQDLNAAAKESEALSLICRLDGDEDGASAFEAEARQLFVAGTQRAWRLSTRRPKDQVE